MTITVVVITVATVAIDTSIGTAEIHATRPPDSPISLRLADARS